MKLTSDLFKKPALLLGAGLFLFTACSTLTPQQQGAVQARECSIYFTIVGYLRDTGREAPASITQGCPERFNSIADMASVDEANRPRGATADRLYGQMLSRGVPQDVADVVRRSYAFREWVNLSEGRAR